MSAEPEFEMVLPFVTVESVGGPHEDNAYTAGWEMGTLDAELSVLALVHGAAREVVIRVDNEQQADLVCMKHGFTVVDRTNHGDWLTLVIGKPYEDES